MYIILVSNLYFLLKVIILLFPYINYNYKNIKLYVLIRDRIPFLKSQVLVLQKQEKAQKNWNTLKKLLKNVQKTQHS